MLCAMAADSVGTWLGVAVSVVGFGLALWQIREARWSARRAETAAEAAAGASQAVRGQLAGEELRGLLHALRGAHQRLVSLASPLDAASVSVELRVWIEAASSLLAMRRHLALPVALVAELQAASDPNSPIAVAKNAAALGKAPRPMVWRQVLVALDGCDREALVTLTDLRYTKPMAGL